MQEHVYIEAYYGSRDVPNGIDQVIGRGWVHGRNESACEMSEEDFVPHVNKRVLQ